MSLGRARAIAASASSALVAVATFHPFAERMYFTSTRLVGLSSTTSTSSAMITSLCVDAGARQGAEQRRGLNGFRQELAHREAGHRPRLGDDGEHDDLRI